MATYSSNPDGTITEEEISYLRRRSKDVGMVITAACYVSPDGQAFDGQWSCADDAMIPSLRRAAEAIKSAGAVAVLQLHHGGRLCRSGVIGESPLSASAVAAERPGAETPREMTEEEIERTIKAFGQAARRAIRAGFDGVEIHGANGYLLQQFFSPHSNLRTDQWGGTLENRAAFPIAVLEEVQEVVRRNAYTPFCIGYRLSPEEVESPGIAIADTLQLVEGLAACRPDWIHVSTQDYYAGSLRNPADRRPRAALVARQVRGRTVVIGSGSLNTPELAVAPLADGVSLVAIGRALLIEPEWGAKVLSGNAEELRRCLPAGGAVEELSIPAPMYARLLGTPGWLPVCSEPQGTGIRDIDPEPAGLDSAVLGRGLQHPSGRRGPFTSPQGMG